VVILSQFCSKANRNQFYLQKLKTIEVVLRFIEASGFDYPTSGRHWDEQNLGIVGVRPSIIFYAKLEIGLSVLLF